jgi:hypothetical protein
MVTSVGMLEKHYSHLEPVLVAEKLAGKRQDQKTHDANALTS